MDSDTDLKKTGADTSKFHGEIRVASRIIDYLSSGLYESPAACLKELVNNSYDADASLVKVFVKPDANRIIIEDNGTGMNRDDFERHFSRISESHKREVSDETTSGRKKIGKIGIGFIAANELCEVLEIFSTKSGSTDLLHITIDFKEMRKPPADRKREGDDYSKADYNGEILEASEDEQYTQILLKEVRGTARDVMAGAVSQTEGQPVISLYGLSRESIANELRNGGIATWKQFDAYSETLLEIALNVPVRYAEEWMPKSVMNKVSDYISEVSKSDFNVHYDGTELRKPIIFSPPNDRILVERFNFDGNYVSAHGYFYAQHGTIKPLELHGLLVRIRLAAVGNFDDSFWKFSHSEYPLIQRWVSAEIWADDRLEEAMNIDRKTLRLTHPAYVELRDALHTFLRTFLNKTRAEIYQTESDVRKQARTAEAVSDVENLAETVITKYSPASASRLRQMATNAKNSPRANKVLQRKYEISEVYRVLVNAAKGVISDEQLTQILDKLTDYFGN